MTFLLLYKSCNIVLHSITCTCMLNFAQIQKIFQGGPGVIDNFDCPHGSKLLKSLNFSGVQG